MWTGQSAKAAAPTPSLASCSVPVTVRYARIPVRGTAEDPMPPATRTHGSSRASSAGVKSAPKRESMASTPASQNI